MATGVLVACLRVLDVQKLLLGGCRSTVPRTGAVASLDAGEKLGLVPVDALLRDPVHPEALVRRGDVARDHGAARDLGRGTQRWIQSGTKATQGGISRTWQCTWRRCSRAVCRMNDQVSAPGREGAGTGVQPAPSVAFPEPHTLQMVVGSLPKAGQYIVSTPPATANAPPLWAIWSTFSEHNKLASAQPCPPGSITIITIKGLESTG